jgi:uncharacterized membrane protein YidH (DUF202 family)
VTGPPGQPRRAIPDDLEDLDPGFSRERTQLAWRRTAISFTAVSAAMLKVEPIAGVPLVVMALAVWAANWRDVRTDPRRRSARAQRRAINSIALTTVLAALVALLVALTVDGRSP